MTTALLVIDVQNAFYDGVFAPPIPDAEVKLRAVCELLSRARAAGIPVIFVQHCEDGSEFDRAEPSWNLHAALDVREGERLIEKTRPDSFLETDLAQELDRLGATHLVVAGNQTEFCVDTTTRVAVSRGYSVTLASDAHGTWDGADLSAAQIVDHHNRVLAGFASVRPTSDIAFAMPLPA